MSSALSSGEFVFNGSLIWANSAVANTAGTTILSGGNAFLDIALPTALQRDGLYVISVTNPSVDTSLTVSVKNNDSFGGVTQYPELARFSVAVNTPSGKVALVQGLFCALAGRIVITNDQAVSGAGSFTAQVLVRKV